MAFNRREDIDIAKGIGELLVIIGHTFSSVMGSTALMNSIYTIIYSFHMPLLFFVSGYFSKKLLSCECKPKAIKDKAHRLPIPYFVWGGDISTVESVVGTFCTV